MHKPRQLMIEYNLKLDIYCNFTLATAHAILHRDFSFCTRLDADVNDLPWEYTVESYPSFIFFPARRWA